MVEIEERGSPITERRCRRIPVIQVYLRSGSGNGGNLDPDYGVVGSGLLYPVRDRGVINGGEPDVREIGFHVRTQVHVLSDIGAGGVVDGDPDLVIGQVTQADPEMV